MICYFRKGFKSSIKFEIKQQNRESMNFEEMVQRAINMEAKAGLRSSIMVRDLDICCLRGYRSSNNITSKMQTQRTTAKNSHPEESKVKEARLTLSQAKASKPFEQIRKEKKKKKHQERRDKKRLWLAPLTQ